MKLFRTILTYDVIVVAETEETANAAVIDWAKSGELAPSETCALETRRDTEIRPAWRDRKPIVAADVGDDDFQKRVKGRTSIQMFEQLYTKQAPKPK